MPGRLTFPFLSFPPMSIMPFGLQSGLFSGVFLAFHSQQRQSDSSSICCVDTVPSLCDVLCVVCYVWWNSSPRSFLLTYTGKSTN